MIGEDRDQQVLLPASLEDYVGDDNPVRVVDVYVDELDLGELGFANMVDGLDKRLKANPNDANGWIMLIRSRQQLGQTVQAKKALADGLAAFKNNAAEAKRIREAAGALG